MSRILRLSQWVPRWESCARRLWLWEPFAITNRVQLSTVLENKNAIFNLISYHPHNEQTDPTSGHLANLAACMHWDAEWNSKRANQAKHEFRERIMPGSIETVRGWKWTEELETEHASCCKDHEINPTAVRSIAKLIETVIVHVFYHFQFEPEWLRCCNPTPLWKRRSEWRGPQAHGRCMIQRVYKNSEILCQSLTALCNRQISNGVSACP
jgi:hypothetical protein